MIVIIINRPFAAAAAEDYLSAARECAAHVKRDAFCIVAVGLGVRASFYCYWRVACAAAAV
jgi:hypothetical protein